MKKILSILMLLMAGVAAYATETVLWEGNYSDGIEINSETIATFKAGDVLCVYVTVPEGGANFKICYKGAGNGWSETAIPSLNNQWPWVNGGQNTFEITLTGDDLTALSGENIYIYKGDNSVITKVTLKSADAEPEPEPEPEPEVPAFSLDNFTADEGNSYDAATHTLTVTNAWSGGQLWIGENSTYSGSKLVIKTTDDCKLKVLVGYVGGGDVDMMDSEATKKHMLEIDDTKKIEKVIIQNQEATAIIFESMELDPEEDPEPEPEPEPVSNTFDENGVADLSKVEAQGDKVTYDAETHTVTTTEGWTGVQLTVSDGEEVSGKELRITFDREMSVKCYVKYTDGTDADVIMGKAEKILYFTLDGAKKLYQVQIQPTDAATFAFEEIAVNAESTKPVVKPLEEGETRVIFKDEAGLAVSWNNFCEKDAEWGAVLEAGEYFFVTVSARDPRQEWPKIVLRDASSAAVGEDIDLNGVSSFPYIARFALTDGMVEQLRNGFCFSGDGFTVTQVAVYKPETGGESVSLDALNYTLNARYDVLSHNITTTRRWGRAGWEIDGDEYADRTLIVVDYKSVAFPVTLKIEYTTEDGVRMGYSAGSAAGNTQVSLDIPRDMASLKLIYITYPDGNSLELTDITLMAAANARPLAGERILPTAVDGLEAVEEDSEDDGVWYNLSGQRVDRPAHGIYIRNGRKVFVK